VDLVAAGLAKSEERAKVVDFSSIYIESGTLFLVPKDSSIQSWRDLKGKTVATVQGTVYLARLRHDYIIILVTMPAGFRVGSKTPFGNSDSLIVYLNRRGCSFTLLAQNVSHKRGERGAVVNETSRSPRLTA
jgi:hypothetical protein